MKIGIAKGRSQKHMPQDPFEGLSPRRCHVTKDDNEFFLLRPSVIPGMVMHGVLDLGVCGSDVVEEFSMKDDLNHWVLSQMGNVRIVAAAADVEFIQRDHGRPIVIGTPYPGIASKWFRPWAHIVVEQPGCVEGLCPKLVDIVVDIAESGDTLREHGLHIFLESPLLNLMVIARGNDPRITEAKRPWLLGL